MALLSLACKSTQQGATPKLKKKSSKFLLKKLAANKIEAEWLSAKAKVTYSDDNETRKFTTNIRMRKDSVIWINIKKLGREFVRVLITQDSVYAINRHERTYTIKGIDLLNEQFGLLVGNNSEQTAFQALQDILLGNPVFIPVEKFNAGIDDQSYTLEGQFNNINNKFWINGDRYLLSKMLYDDEYRNRVVSFELDEYNSLGEYENFSYFRILNLSGLETGETSLKLKLSSVEINTTKSIRFDIPSQYKRVD